ncbi:MAG TPA: aminotransferase class I/II-fold pyridoxal phosphate-dependent enzyme [Saprospiraceae bacterium]|nr:aminotransferase class I/II-fold pyridoxal phosphate-dependent enzyme [Saprospiraceae bacterium]
MTKNAPPATEKINQIVQHCAKLGVSQIITEDTHLDGRAIRVENKEMINFGSCSYLGLEVDPRLKQKSKEAIDNFGTQYSCSRAFVAISPYEELEEKLSQLFGYPTVLAPTTTLGHLSNIPVLVGQNDAVILDHKVHSSIQNAVQIVKAKGTHIEMIRHNRMDILEERIQKLQREYKKVWYMADGIYSMYGDFAPVKKIYDLLEKYEQFHFYVDDAHGMSWAGENGKGYVLSQIPYHERMILILSLAKGFGSCGGALVFPDTKTRDLVKNCGSTLMFSGPLQPSLLGASIASADIHLSSEIYQLQENLQSRIKYFIEISKAYDLTLVGDFRTPIFFFAVGAPEMGYKICRRMMDRGFYTNLAAYPSVPYYNTGIRITLNNNHSYADIRNCLSAFQEEFTAVMKEENYDKEKIYKAFRKNGFFHDKIAIPKLIKKSIAL